MKRILLAAVAAFFVAAAVAGATEVDNLDNLAAAITNSNNSANMARIRSYAVAQAAATQSQETAIRDLQAKVADLQARVTKLEGGSPPPPAAACANGVDDDNDGKIDLADPGCSNSADTDETDPAPPPPVAKCADGLDNDGDGKVDLADPGCSSSTDDDETDPSPPPSGNVFVAPTGNDANACTATAPCRTLLRGYAAAASGDTVSVPAGQYGGGIWTGTKTVTFQAVGTVQITSVIEIRSLSNVTFNGDFVSTVPGEQDWSLRINGLSRNLTFNGFSGSHFDLTDCATNITFKGGSWGGYSGRPWGGDTSIGGDQTMTLPCGDGIVRNIILDGVRFHDVQYGPSDTWGGAHPDCIQVGGAVDGLIIRNSIIERCGNTFIGTFLDWGDMRNFTVENTLFRQIADSGAAVQIGNKPGWVCAGIVFRYNTFDSGDVPPLINCPTDPNGQVYGNIFTSKGSCGQAVWSYNIWGSAPCGTNSIAGTVAFVNKAAGDYHLASGSIAIGKGDPGRYPAFDFEGTTRTSPPDAGYDQH